MTVSILLESLKDDGQRLSECKHESPFSILGPQPFKDKWIIRIWMPEASEVELIIQRTKIQLQNSNHECIFEGIIEKDPGTDYQVKVNRGGIEHVQNDPWSFRKEWMGEIDRHLFAEGNHHHIWRKMGAHLTEIDKKKGVMFCLWAPNAKSVSVIGDLNSWDGRHHPMQKRLGGIWELFIPSLNEGDLYKYEIRTE